MSSFSNASMSACWLEKNKDMFTKRERENIYPVVQKIKTFLECITRGGHTWPTQSTTDRINFKSSRPGGSRRSPGVLRWFPHAQLPGVSRHLANTTVPPSCKGSAISLQSASPPDECPELKYLSISQWMYTDITCHTLITHNCHAEPPSIVTVTYLLLY